MYRACQVLRLSGTLRIVGLSSTQKANYAVAPPGSGGAKKKSKAGVQEVKEVPVETDPKKLVENCCGLNYTQTGGEVQLKADSEYPDWLWRMELEQPLSEHTADPNSIVYWARVIRAENKRRRQLIRLRGWRDRDDLASVQEKMEHLYGHWYKHLKSITKQKAIAAEPSLRGKTA